MSKQSERRFAITKDSIIADVIEAVPASLDYLIGKGFTPLADPVMRQNLTPHVTLQMASEVHSLDLEVLVSELNRLAEQQATESDERSSIPMTQAQNITLDVREIPPYERHPKIFAIIDSLEPGQALELVNDHEPKPLYYQIQAEKPGQYDWESREEGPRHWVAVITRRKACC